MVSNAVGSPVKGADFFDRKREILHIWERLETDSVLLLAPRRVGKTSLMYRLQEDASAWGFSAVYLSVSDVTTELAFIERLYAAAQTVKPAKRAVGRLAKGPLGRFFRRIKKLGLFGVSFELGDGADGLWGQLGEALTRELNQLEKRWLFLVDELPIFVLALLRQDPTGNRARTFLNWFRQLRLDRKGSERVRWLIAGSIGLDTVTRRMKLGDTINDLYLFNDFGAFREEVAEAFLDELSHTYKLPLSPAVKAQIRARTGWLIPYHLQLFFSELRTWCGDGGVEPTPEAVDAAHEALLSPGRKAYFDYWEQRLTEELGPPDDRQAIALLNAAAKDPQGASLQVLRGVLGQHIQNVDERDEKLRYLLDVLRSDGYLIAEGERFQFRSSLLRDYWARRLLP